MLPFRLHSVSVSSHYIKLVKMGINSVGFIWHSHLLVCTSNTNSCAAALLFSAWVHPTSLAPHLQIFLKETTLHYFEWLSIPGAVIRFEKTTHKEKKNPKPSPDWTSIIPFREGMSFHHCCRFPLKTVEIPSNIFVLCLHIPVGWALWWGKRLVESKHPWT